MAEGVMTLVDALIHVMLTPIYKEIYKFEWNYTKQQPRHVGSSKKRKL